LFPTPDVVEGDFFEPFHPTVLRAP
jgi:hypothetical protein